MHGLLPLPTELGFTRVRHMNRSKSETSDFDWGEGWGEGASDSRYAVITRLASLGDLSHRTLVYLSSAINAVEVGNIRLRLGQVKRVRGDSISSKHALVVAARTDLWLLRRLVFAPKIEQFFGRRGRQFDVVAFQFLEFVFRSFSSE